MTAAGARGAASGWTGLVLLDAGSFLYLGPGASADEHSHHAVQLVWARDAPVRLTLAGEVIAARATLIPAHLEHALEASGPIALLLVEPHGPRGAALDRLARAHSGADAEGLLRDLPFPRPGLRADEALAWRDAVLRALVGPASATPLSSVSRRAVALIEVGLGGVPRLADVAARIGISPTRLTHLFTREVGVPFRRFILWSRIKRAVVAVQRGADLTGAALEAGFSDAAHLSRTFREMFGLSPSAVLPVATLVGRIWTAASDQRGPP